jgi:hypothetical protein
VLIRHDWIDFLRRVWLQPETGPFSEPRAKKPGSGRERASRAMHLEREVNHAGALTTEGMNMQITRDQFQINDEAIIHRQREQSSLRLWATPTALQRARGCLYVLA